MGAISSTTLPSGKHLHPKQAPASLTHSLSLLTLLLLTISSVESNLHRRYGSGEVGPDALGGATLAATVLGTLEGRELDYSGGPPGPPVPVTADLCTKLRLFNASGIMPFGAANWSSVANTSAFLAGPCLKVAGIHLAQMMDKRLVITDRSDTVNTGQRYPGTRRPVIAVEVTLTDSPPRQRLLDLVTENYCSTAFFRPDGSLSTVGGFFPLSSPVGRTAVRGFAPCPESFSICNCTFEGNLTSYRWYPTSQILPEGRAIVIGGAGGADNINNKAINNPTWEYWPPRNPGDVKVPISFLGGATLPYNLFPIVHLLPSGRIFIFAGVRWTLFDTTTNDVVPPPTGGYPVLSRKGSNGRIIFRNYPNAGSSALFPLGSATQYQAEIMICGGCPDFANKGQHIPCEDKCYRIQPESATPAWAQEQMCADYPNCTVPMPRVLADLVLLADGSVLVLNGGATKKNRYPISGAAPVLTPLRYDPYSHSWYNDTLATSFIPRMYHSNALLLHDGTVFVSGSNPNRVYTIKPSPFFAETRTEFFQPPYFFTGTSPPVLIYAPARISVKERFAICFTAADNASSADELALRFRVALSHPGASTHNLRHSMRHVDLDSTVTALGGGRFSAQVVGPPSLNVAPPTFYWIFVLDNGVPNKEGQAILINTADMAKKFIKKKQYIVPPQCYPPSKARSK